jgi:L-ribulose-5-phosphate 3-epimerase
MSETTNRREFLIRSAGTALALGLGGALPAFARGSTACSSNAREEKAVPEERPRKALIYGMLPNNLSMEDRFKLARDVGFDGVESGPIGDPAECEKMRAAAEKAGLRIHSVIYGGWDPPLTTGDPEAAARSIKNAENALRSAKNLGADDILLVPGVVNAQTRYADAYTRSQANIKKLIPLAQELKILLCIENVWNNFLLSPLEFARYVDEFKSPWVQSYFDVGNVVRFAWPEDWIRTLGRRIKKVHLKDFKGGPGLWGPGDFCALREGSIVWPEVRRAFAEIGYAGFMTTELGGGDETYLRDVSARVDKILAGE